MSRNIRVIPRLDIKGPSLVKGIRLEGLRVLGDPRKFSKYYYENGADEIFYQDVVASLYERNSLDQLLSEAVKDCFVPITVGGGIRSLNDIYKVLGNGADKISINTAAVKNPKFIYEAVKEFGSSTISISVECIKNTEDKSYYIFTDNGREYSGINVIEWIKTIQDYGVGEIILTSVDNEGTGEGFNYELVENVASLINVPFLVHGGAGKIQDVLEICQIEKITGIVIASCFHYAALKLENEMIRGEIVEGNTDFLRSKSKYIKHKLFTINELKYELFKNGFNVRFHE